MKSVCEHGIVVTTGDGTVRVRLLKEPECRKCGLAALGVCATGGAGFELDAVSREPVTVGEKVRVVRGGRSFTDGGFLMFGLPVLALALGAVSGAVLAPLVSLSGDTAAVVGGFSALALAVFAAIPIGRHRDRRGHFLPTVRKL